MKPVLLLSKRKSLETPFCHHIAGWPTAKLLVRAQGTSHASNPCRHEAPPHHQRDKVQPLSHFPGLENSLTNGHWEGLSEVPPTPTRERGTQPCVGGSSELQKSKKEAPPEAEEDSTSLTGVTKKAQACSICSLCGGIMLSVRVRGWRGCRGRPSTLHPRSPLGENGGSSSRPTPKLLGLCHPSRGRTCLKVTAPTSTAQLAC